nr:MAG TPA: hypothetical protein [Herelleviridae sp.]
MKLDIYMVILNVFIIISSCVNIYLLNKKEYTYERWLVHYNLSKYCLLLWVVVNIPYWILRFI